MVCIELARVDGSMSTFLMVHNSLLMLTIGLLGSEQQKKVSCFQNPAWAVVCRLWCAPACTCRQLPLGLQLQKMVSYHSQPWHGCLSMKRSASC